MANSYQLMRKYISTNLDSSFEVFLKNGKKLQGKVSNVDDRTFMLICQNKGGSLVYFSKVSTIGKLEEFAEYKSYQDKISTSYDNPRPSKTQKPVIISKSRSKLMLTPSDIEQQRFHEQRQHG
ncbi:RNA chaperone Hfq [Pseudoalteromonas sp. OFAV1]|jgi:sRNA-binding regulator protein Hfq|uniref:RNA chaperone Hfq n=1 Tax=Pseudoalteromonas sp. OFAV1 TaxID=2908892 RepID=UPI001F2A52F4|nr:RNA chaperone Hfq [Pseudoalteromonas sp. OFAV1]MCF2900893.1 RNA chaperone Hfq [Pseudoalteromonas sp. OFAV1]